LKVSVIFVSKNFSGLLPSNFHLTNLLVLVTSPIFSCFPVGASISGIVTSTFGFTQNVFSNLVFAVAFSVVSTTTFT